MMSWEYKDGEASQGKTIPATQAHHLRGMLVSAAAI